MLYRGEPKLSFSSNSSSSNNSNSENEDFIICHDKLFGLLQYYCKKRSVYLIAVHCRLHKCTKRCR